MGLLILFICYIDIFQAIFNHNYCLIIYCMYSMLLFNPFCDVISQLEERMIDKFFQPGALFTKILNPSYKNLS